MKYLFSFIILFIASNVLYSQDKVQLNVVYQFTHTNDLANTRKPYTASMILTLGINSSRYMYKKKYDEFITRKRIIKEMETDKNHPGIPVVGMPFPMLYEVVVNEEISKTNTAMLVAGKIGVKTYYYATSIPKIKWTLGKEKKNIIGYACQQATGEYKGRTYEVWFTPDLPYSDGPWKLSGLPGLILLASDNKKEVIIEAKDIIKDADEDETTASIVKTARSIPVSEKDFTRSRESFEKDPDNFVVSQSPNRSIVIADVDENGEKITRIKKYNPIELK